jgi:hypothetical protein
MRSGRIAAVAVFSTNGSPHADLGAPGGIVAQCGRSGIGARTPARRDAISLAPPKSQDCPFANGTVYGSQYR